MPEQTGDCEPVSDARPRGRALSPATVAMQDQIIETLREAAPLPLSTGQLVRALPLVKGVWEKVHRPCPTCTCGEHWQPYRHGGVHVDNGKVTSITKRLERQGVVERFRSHVMGQADSWRWIGE